MELAAVEAMRAAGWAALGHEEVRDRVRGALLGSACGDALGAPFEGQAEVDPAELGAHRHGSAQLSYTGDTVMTLVLAQHLSARLVRDAELETDELARAFAFAWRNEPWRGYGSGPEHVFRSVLLGVPCRKAAASLFGGSGSFGNGGAMRVAPVALLGRSLGLVLDWARRSARVTHLHPIGQAGAALQAAAVALAASGSRQHPLDPRRFLSAVDACHGHPAFSARLRRLSYVLDDERPARVVRSIGHGIPALESVPAALLAFLRSPDEPSEVLDFAVRLGGQTDSITAMAGALVGARCGAARLPRELLVRIECGPRILAVADALARCAQPHAGDPDDPAAAYGEVWAQPVARTW
ncbi:ADP-ribosylglycohydrolase family protein [Pseudonocardia sp. H11422]|uniref:ADP-ribosylglycohydrolase family protein n=1 Tax=Pseudonocardia sp. H11422 TaxID=2835866 RepID=UPI001BDC95FB|nr:ADP-ribosylglycohydrolase family protein [Pseudonocardia sp. H11422]